MAWYKVADSNTPLHTIAKVKAGGKYICLVYSHENWYALNSRCPHAGADLSHGWCDNGKLVCPVHRYSYDLATGKGAPGQNDYIKMYPIQLRDDGVYVEVKSIFENLKELFTDDRRPERD